MSIVISSRRLAALPSTLSLTSTSATVRTHLHIDTRTHSTHPRLHSRALTTPQQHRRQHQHQHQHQHQQSRNMASATKFYDFTPKDKKGEPYNFSQLKGKVVLIVNTASKCRFTPQFAGLEQLYKDIKAQPNGADFEILGFPCNQFDGQDPGDDDTIQSFCQVNYGVTFPVLAKTEVNGDKAEPLYDWLKSEKAGLLGLQRIKWNFEKFLVGRDGQVKGRWASVSKPDSLKKDINRELESEKKSEL